MMGSEGLRIATENAILNANYVAYKLKEFFPILYKGKNGNVAHECIIDIRSIKLEKDFKESINLNDHQKAADYQMMIADFGFAFRIYGLFIFSTRCWSWNCWIICC